MRTYSENYAVIIKYINLIEKEISKYHLLSCFTMNIMFKFELVGEAHQFKLESQPNKKGGIWKLLGKTTMINRRGNIFINCLEQQIPLLLLGH